MAKFARSSTPRLSAPPLSVSASTSVARPVGPKLEDALDEHSPEKYDYYGDPRSLVAHSSGLRIGVPPESDSDWQPVGEKVILREYAYDDLEVAVDITPNPGRGFDSGVLFRVTDCSVGFDSQRGYFAGIVPAENRVIIGKTDGVRWVELNRVVPKEPIPPTVRLMVRVLGKQILVHLNGRPVAAARDSEYSYGAVGLRVVHTDALFSNLTVQPLPVS